MVNFSSFIFGSFFSIIALKIGRFSYKVYPYFFNKSYINSTKKIDKKIAIISGSTDGLGKQFVKKLIDEKFSLILLGRSNEKMNKIFDEYSEKIKQNQILLQKYKIDFAEKNIQEHQETIKNLSNLLRSSLSKCEQLKNKNIQIGFINCCGEAHISDYSSTSLQNIQKLEKVNLNAFHIMTKLLFEAKSIFKENKSQKQYFLINISSGVDNDPNLYSSIYSGSKAFQSNVMKVLNQQQQKNNTSNEKTFFLNVSPLYIKTKMVRFLKQWDVAETSEIVDGAFKLLGRRNQGTGCIKHQFIKDFPIFTKQSFKERVQKAMQLKKKMQSLKNRKRKDIKRQ